MQLNLREKRGSHIELKGLDTFFQVVEIVIGLLKRLATSKLFW